MIDGSLASKNILGKWKGSCLITEFHCLGHYYTDKIGCLRHAVSEYSGSFEYFSTILSLPITSSSSPFLSSYIGVICFRINFRCVDHVFEQNSSCHHK